MNEQRSTPGASDWDDFTLAQWNAFTLAQWQSFKLDASTGVYNTTYTYDPVGNRLVKNDSGALTTSTYDAANQIQTSMAAAGVTTYTFDQPATSSSSTSPVRLTTSTWDDQNRNTLVQLPSAITNTFVYNGDNLRVQKQDSSGTTRFLWDGQAYLAETDGSNVTQAEYTSEPTEFGCLISQRRLTNGLWVPSYYQFDGLGSTLQLTNSSGVATDSYLYKAFGELLSGSGTTINPFRYVGQLGYYFDQDTGDYNVRERLLIVIIARWASW